MNPSMGPDVDRDNRVRLFFVGDDRAATASHKTVVVEIQADTATKIAQVVPPRSSDFGLSVSAPTAIGPVARPSHLFSVPWSQLSRGHAITLEPDP
jgi:hypothetical protein